MYPATGVRVSIRLISLSSCYGDKKRSPSLCKWPQLPFSNFNFSYSNIMKNHSPIVGEGNFGHWILGSRLQSESIVRRFGTEIWDGGR